MENNKTVTKGDLQKYSVRELKQFLIDNDTPIPNSYTGKSKNFFLSKAIAVLDKANKINQEQETSFASPRQVNTPRVPMTRTRSGLSNIDDSESSSSEGEVTIDSPEKKTRQELISVIQMLEEPPTGIRSYKKAELVKLVYDLGLVEGQEDNNEIIETTPKKAKIVKPVIAKKTKSDLSWEETEEYKTEEIRKQLFKQESIKKPEVFMTSPKKVRERKLVDSLNTLDNDELFDNSEIASPTQNKPRPDSPLPKLKQLTPLKLTPRPKRKVKVIPENLDSSFGMSGVDADVKRKVKKMRSKATDTSLSSSLDNSFSFNKQFDYIEPSYFQSPKAKVKKMEEKPEPKLVRNSYSVLSCLLILTVLLLGLTSIIYYNLTFQIFCKKGEFTDCTPCPTHGVCSKYFLTCNKGFKKSNGLCIENNEVLETALKLASSIADRARKLSGKNCTNESPVALSDDSLLNISVQAPGIFTKALDFIRSNPSKYKVTVSERDNFTFHTKHPIFTLDCYVNEFFSFVYNKLYNYTKMFLKELISVKYIQENKNAFTILVAIIFGLLFMNWYVNRKLTRTQMFNRVVKLIWARLKETNNDRKGGEYKIPLEYLKDDIFPNGDEVVWKEAVKEVVKDSRVVYTCEVIEGEQMDCIKLGEAVYSDRDFGDTESVNATRDDMIMSPSKTPRF
eukprot:GAHX01001283.1.p1 GENE.GAHX01001283.1~~GAHX01001283.1.p1  ORF type:complete len:676 (-),score=162.30 GAHX01001283.1:47-2074(-)